MISRARLEALLDAAAPAVVAACVLAAAAGSSIQRDILAFGRPARWALLAVLLLFALVRATLALGDWRFPRWTAVALIAFCGLSFVSVAWSVNWRGTAERSLAQAAAVGAVGLLSGCAASRPRLARSLVDGVIAAAAAVALAGFVYWLVSPSHAAIAATTDYASRYQGIEQNPNTAPLLLAIGMPLALARALGARGRLARGAFVLLVLVFTASICASGSRGGLLAGFTGLLVVAALAPLAPRRRLGLALAVVAALAVSVWAITLPKPLPTASGATTVPSTRVASRDAEASLPLSQEIGNPWWTSRPGGSRRSLFNTSVRARALRGAIRLALDRPLLGYGFGAEQWAFVNRYYAFDSGNPENGYVGLFLQLGAAGLALFLVAAGLCVVPGVRACLRGRGGSTTVAAAGGAAAGLALGLSQSYFHGPGNIAYVALWISLLLTAVAVQLGGRPA